MSLDIGTLTGQIEIEDQVSSALTLITARVEKFATDFEGALGAVAVGAGVAVTAIAAMTGAVVSLGMRGSDINDVASTLDHFAGSAENAEAIMANLRRGTMGTVDDFDLLRSSSGLLSKGVKLTAADFGTLGEAAFVLQNRGLGGTKEMLELVSGALTTGRTRSLAMALGVVDADNATEKYAKSLGLAESELTKTQRVEATRIAVMEMLSKATRDAGPQVKDFGEIIDSMIVSTKNWFDTLAQKVAASPQVLNALNAIGKAFTDNFGGAGATAMDTIMNWINKFADAVAFYGPKVIAWIKDAIQYVRDLYKEVMAAWDAVPAWFRDMAKEAALAGGAVVLLNKASQEATGESMLSNLGSVATIWSALSGHIGSALKYAKEFALVNGGLLAGLKTIGSGWVDAVVGAIGATGMAGIVAAGTAAGVAYMEGWTKALLGSGGGLHGQGGMKGLQDNIADVISGKGSTPHFTYDIEFKGVVGDVAKVDPKPLVELTDTVKKLRDMLLGLDVKKEISDISQAISAAGGVSKIAAPQLWDLGEKLLGMRNKGYDLPPLLDKIADRNKALADSIKEVAFAQETEALKNDKYNADMERVTQSFIALGKLGDEIELGNIEQQIEDIGGVAHIAAPKLNDLGTRLLRLRNNGLTLPRELNDIADETENAADATAKWSDTLAEHARRTKESDEAHDKLFADMPKDWDLAVEKAHAYGDGLINVGQAMNNIVGVTVSGIGSMINTWVDMASRVRDIGKVIDGVAVKAVSASEKISAVMSSIAGVIGAAGSGSTANRVVGGAIQGSIGALATTTLIAGHSLSIAAGAVTLGIGAIAGAIYGYISAIKAAAAAALKRDEQYDLLHVNVDKVYGSFAKAERKAQQFGIALADATGSVGHRSELDLRRVQDQLEDLANELHAVDEAVSRYGMTWADLKTPSDRFEASAKAADGLLKSMDRLTRAGYDHSAIVRGMSGDINDWLRNSIRAGEKIPASMRPIIEELIKTKQLTEENARALMGLANDSIPSLDSITEAADRYGLKLDDLGGKVQQLRINDQAKTIVDDFNTLVAAGVPFEALLKDTTFQVTDTGAKFSEMSDKAQQSYLDMGGKLSDVTVGMHHDIQELVNKSLTLGTTLPSSMKPIIEKMIELGGDNGLVDQTGAALTDVSQLNFETPIADKIDDLIDKLDEWMGKMDGSDGVSHTTEVMADEVKGYWHDMTYAVNEYGNAIKNLPSYRPSAVPSGFVPSAAMSSASRSGMVVKQPVNIQVGRDTVAKAVIQHFVEVGGMG